MGDSTLRLTGVGDLTASLKMGELTLSIKVPSIFQFVGIPFLMLFEAVDVGDLKFLGIFIIFRAFPKSFLLSLGSTLEVSGGRLRGKFLFCSSLP